MAFCFITHNDYDYDEDYRTLVQDSAPADTCCLALSGHGGADSHAVARHLCHRGCGDHRLRAGLQILSNLINDYYDFVRGTDQKGRAGFKRALAEGEVSKRQMQWACLTALAVSVGCGLFLVVHGGWVILAIGVSALLFAWLYTATSHSLSYLGVADIFVFLYYGVIASSGTYYLQTGQFAWSVWCAGGVSGLISMCVLLINNLRDMDSDRLVGKRTFPVRFGRRAALCLMGTVVALMPVLAYLALGWSLAMLVVVPAAALFAATLRAKGATYNKLLMAAGIINIIYVVLMAV